MLCGGVCTRLPFIQCYDVDSELRENHPSY